jgi:putative membrane-bound dehydrogenase-like protein
MKPLTIAAVLCLSAVTLLQAGVAEEPALNVPDGFEAVLFADDDLAHDIHSLTFNSAGHLVVSGPGYVRTLRDTNDDGRADQVRTFAESPRSGAQGMFFLGHHLLCSGDDGLQMFRDDNRDGKADGTPEIFLRVLAGREHDAHAIRMGPDGWWYVIAGNMAGVSAAYATLETSPVKKPQSGTLLRLKPDLSGGEIVADGFRNAYDFDFSATGDIFTFDSDGERDVSLPWYEPTRVFQITPRSHAGWVSRSWKRPDHFPDMPPVTGRFGRGSPSGVVCYRHDSFPIEYHGALFVLDWTFGRIIALPLEQDGSVSTAEAIPFATGQGQYGFAPTDAAVSPDGDLYVSIGGRGTRGGVFRISWTNANDQNVSDETPVIPDEDVSELDMILTARQPDSSWSRTFWVPKARRLTSGPFEDAAIDETRPDAERIRAIEILTELYGGVRNETATVLAQSESAQVKARAIWSVGRSHSGAVPTDIVNLYLQDTNPFVLRCALEALSTQPSSQKMTDLLPALASALMSEDRCVRAAASTAVARLDEADWSALLKMFGKDHAARITAELGRRARTDEVRPESIEIALPVISEPQWSDRQKLDATRLIQVALGDVGPQRGRPAVFDSVAPILDLSEFDVQLTGLATGLSQVFPTGSPDVDRELLRIIGMIQPVGRDLLPRILEGISDESDPGEDIHRLMVLARLDAERTFELSTATAAALVNLDVKIHAQGLPQDANWDDRIREMYTALCEVDPAIRQVIVDQPGFGLPGHVLLLSQVSEDKVPVAIEHFARHIQEDESFDWSNDVIFAIGESEVPEHRQLIRQQLDNLSVRGAVLMVLAETPLPADRDLFIDGLSSGQINVVEACLNAITKLPPSRRSREQFALLAVARRLINSPREYAMRETAMRLLQNNTSQEFGFVYDTDGHRPQPGPLQQWNDWLRETFPEFNPPGADTASAEEFLSQLEDIDWDTGDADRGEVLFRKLACAKCHGGRRALGPDLQGVAKRFSRQDMFAAIVDPSRDVSPRYQTTSIVSTTGKTYTGLIVYESVDGLLLRDAEHQTWRIEAEEIDERLQQPTSLMPAGLLKDQSPQDLADLNSYLQKL